MKNKPTGKEIVEQILPYIDEKVKSIDLNRLYTCIDSALDIWAAERMQNLIDELIVIRSATHTQNDYRAITIAIEKSKEYLLEKEEVPEWINAITEPPQLVKGAFKVKIKDGTELYAGWDRRYQPNWIDYYSEEPLDVAFYMPNVETKS
jgi:hypothetical protein